jgi:hypothetical protein
VSIEFKNYNLFHKYIDCPLLPLISFFLPFLGLLMWAVFVLLCICALSF